MNKTMWYVEKPESDTILKACVFDEETLQEFLEDGYKVTGKWNLYFAEGNDFLPDAVG